MSFAVHICLLVLWSLLFNLEDSFNSFFFFQLFGVGGSGAKSLQGWVLCRGPNMNFFWEMLSDSPLFWSGVPGGVPTAGARPPGLKKATRTTRLKEKPGLEVHVFLFLLIVHIVLFFSKSRPLLQRRTERKVCFRQAGRVWDPASRPTPRASPLPPNSCEAAAAGPPASPMGRLAPPLPGSESNAWSAPQPDTRFVRRCTVARLVPPVMCHPIGEVQPSPCQTLLADTTKKCTAQYTIIQK